MSDTETLEPIQSQNSKSPESLKTSKNDRDDLGNMATDFIKCINFKIAIFLFIFGIFILVICL